ncbi:hypothetical protein PLICRDRAFT_181168 [Plicaturopsis crispa FD-325 SS-3]|uniref:Unplaced genomic scaffold PLICRscaffold_216, whole genome shotgun sequence n=1 Tax=Plicaturopsis crispa FD-325 SS-3 TaxID=944288 RepID=A0A0C9T3L7_PLICR|nr:hypothetical protein PLICRDRAFT_181168 [Plicaturopsis crispa FD-325 SS-3]
MRGPPTRASRKSGARKDQRATAVPSPRSTTRPSRIADTRPPPHPMTAHASRIWRAHNRGPAYALATRFTTAVGHAQLRGDTRCRRCPPAPPSRPATRYTASASTPARRALRAADGRRDHHGDPIPPRRRLCRVDRPTMQCVNAPAVHAVQCGDSGRRLLANPPPPSRRSVPARAPASAVSSHGVAPRLAVLTEHQHPRVAEHDAGSETASSATAAERTACHHGGMHSAAAALESERARNSQNDYNNQSFRQTGHERESPQEFIMRRIMHTRMLVHSDYGGPEEVRMVMMRAPLPWKHLLVVESIRSTAILLLRAVENEASLIHSAYIGPVLRQAVMEKAAAARRFRPRNEKTSLTAEIDSPDPVDFDFGAYDVSPDPAPTFNPPPQPELSTAEPQFVEAFAAAVRNARPPPAGGYPFPEADVETQMKKRPPL